MTNDLDDDGLFDGISGLWARVLLNILGDLSKPTWAREYQTAEDMLKHPERTVLPVIGEVLGLPPWRLVEKIRDAVSRKHCRKNRQDCHRSKRHAELTGTK